MRKSIDIIRSSVFDKYRRIVYNSYFRPTPFSMPVNGFTTLPKTVFRALSSNASKLPTVTDKFATIERSCFTIVVSPPGPLVAHDTALFSPAVTFLRLSWKVCKHANISSPISCINWVTQGLVLVVSKLERLFRKLWIGWVRFNEVTLVTGRPPWVKG